MNVPHAAGDYQPVGQRQLTLGRGRPGLADPRACLLKPADVGRRLHVTDDHKHERRGVRARGTVGIEERSPRPAHALARRLLGAVEQLCDLRVREPGLEAQQQHEPLVRAQPGERLARGVWRPGLFRARV